MIHLFAHPSFRLSRLVICQSPPIHLSPAPSVPVWRLSVPSVQLLDPPFTPAPSVPFVALVHLSGPPIHAFFTPAPSFICRGAPIHAHTLCSICQALRRSTFSPAPSVPVWSVMESTFSRPLHLFHLSGTPIHLSRPLHLFHLSSVRLVRGRSICQARRSTFRARSICSTR
jgi:hypothetical protein